jgi:Xaa-Pro aminopeptidase
MNNSIITNRLAALRGKMSEAGVDAYIVSDADTAGSEIPAARFRTREWLTGFDGSAGTCLVTADAAWLWTDGRYWLQAEEQLAGTGIELMRAGADSVPEIEDFLKLSNSTNRYAVGVCGDTTMAAEYDSLADALEPHGITVRDVGDLFDDIWNDRPEMPKASIFLLDSSAAKRNLAALREKLAKRGANGTLICALESVAWLFGFRGSDLEHTPVAYARAFVSQSEAILFIDPEKIPASVLSSFEVDGVRVQKFRDTEKFLDELSDDMRLIYDPHTISSAMKILIRCECHFEEPDPVYFLKAIKADDEIESLRRCHERDGRALIRFFIWLEKQVGKIDDLDAGNITEYDAALKLTELRARDPLCLGDSFEPICAFGANGAIVHYSPRKESARVISAAEFGRGGECKYGEDGEPNAENGEHNNPGECGVLLVDSGGQYLDGTTDITRTVPIRNAWRYNLASCEKQCADVPLYAANNGGKNTNICEMQDSKTLISASSVPGETGRQINRQSPDFRHDYTLVLKAHIALASAEFRYGVAGAHLDALPRRVLWAEGLDYTHGTGHGVGYVLNVHEAPPNISATPRNNPANLTPIEPNMVFSNEPGLYRAGKYGIRIENLVRPYIARENEFGKFLKLETLSLCPIDLSPVMPELLTDAEIDWLNAYHREVYERLAPELTESEKIWLAARTAQIRRSS